MHAQFRSETGSESFEDENVVVQNRLKALAVQEADPAERGSWLTEQYKKIELDKIKTEEGSGPDSIPTEREIALQEKLPLIDVEKLTLEPYTTYVDPIRKWVQSEEGKIPSYNKELLPEERPLSQEEREEVEDRARAFP